MPTLVASELHITVGTEVGNTTIITGLYNHIFTHHAGSVLMITMSLGLLTASVVPMILTAYTVMV